MSLLSGLYRNVAVAARAVCSGPVTPPTSPFLSNRGTWGRVQDRLKGLEKPTGPKNSLGGFVS